MFNKTLAAGMLMLSSGAVLADDAMPYLDINSFVPSLRDAVLQETTPVNDRPLLNTNLSLPSNFFVQSSYASLDAIDAQRTPLFIDNFSLELEKYSMGIGFRRELTPGLDLKASLDLVHLDYSPETSGVLNLEGDTGKSLGLGLTTHPSDRLELGAQWSVTRYNNDPLQRDFNSVDFRATYNFTPNFGLFTQYGVSDDLNGDGQTEDTYRVGGRISF